MFSKYLDWFTVPNTFVCNYFFHLMHVFSFLFGLPDTEATVGSTSDEELELAFRCYIFLLGKVWFLFDLGDVEIM